ncbi:hypothetical protein KR009_011876 [Drosophila setifemur]|nr:hypothetical protein KR009_011876 [Drosophila setifemur]
MSLRKSLLLGCLLVVTAAIAMANELETNTVDEGYTYMLQGVLVYPNDRECVMVGGICVASNDCLASTTNKGLCPTSSALGVECCYELPVRPAPCDQHLGMCMDRCHHRLQRPGTDCENGQVCCVLVT